MLAECWAGQAGFLWLIKRSAERFVGAKSVRMQLRTSSRCRLEREVGDGYGHPQSTLGGHVKLIDICETTG